MVETVWNVDLYLKHGLAVLVAASLTGVSLRIDDISTR